MLYNKLKIKRGFTLVEVIFATVIFATVVISIYNGYAGLTSLISASRDKIAAADLLNEQFEIVRNMPFVNIGLVAGLPPGVLEPSSILTKDGRNFTVTRIVRNIDDPFDGLIDGNPKDFSPADYKMVEISVDCPNCKNFEAMTASSYFAPKNLETASENGALFINVFDANGVPVPQANINIINATEGININETTDNNGILQIVDAPPGINTYRIVVSKPGYTTDMTYAPDASNPNPIKPDATVLLQQVTQVSFIIDKISTINVFSRDLTCAPIINVPFSLTGAKLIGTNPDILKWSGDFNTGPSGVVTLNDIEWDTFNMTVGEGFNLIGVNPPSPFAVLPGSVQNVDIILGAGIPNNLLVTVRDATTNLPLSEVNLTLSQGSWSDTRVTGRGYYGQTDWSQGSGQSNFTDPARYWSDDGNVDVTSSPGEILLLKFLGDYMPSGVLTSSVFDTGTTSNFSNIIWRPIDQPPQTGADPVKFQIATSNCSNGANDPPLCGDGGSWNYIGPDGTAGTYFTTENNNIGNYHDNNRYFRYKVFLNTATSNKTPNIADVAITYASDCIPPGQAIFSNITSSGNHDLLLEKAGYQTQIYPVNIITNDEWQSVEVTMLPE